MNIRVGEKMSIRFDTSFIRLGDKWCVGFWLALHHAAPPSQDRSKHLSLRPFKIGVTSSGVNLPKLAATARICARNTRMFHCGLGDLHRRQAPSQKRRRSQLAARRNRQQKRSQQLPRNAPPQLRSRSSTSCFSAPCPNNQQPKAQLPDTSAPPAALSPQK